MAVINGIYQKYPMMGSNNRKTAGNGNDRSGMPFINRGYSSSNAYKQYQENAVNTASPQELTLMLYNGLVRFLKLAHESIEEKNYEKANNNINRAQNIVAEFASSLDMQYEVSNSLMALYDYMIRRLIEANVKKDNAIIEEVLGYAEQLRDTWAQAMKLAKQQGTASL